MPPIQFPKANDVPIVGQPLKVHGYTLVIAFQCQCSEAPQQLSVTRTEVFAVGQQGTAAPWIKCPSCGKPWAVGPNTQIALDLALGVTAAEAKAAQQPAGQA